MDNINYKYQKAVSNTLWRKFTEWGYRVGNGSLFTVVVVFVEVRVKDPDFLLWLSVSVVGLGLPCSAAHVGSAAVRLGGTDAAADSRGRGIGGLVGAARSLLMPLAAGDRQLRFGPGNLAWRRVDIF